MRKSEYLRLCIKSGIHDELKWGFSVFAIPKLSNLSQDEQGEKFMPVREETGYYFFDENGSKEPIDEVIISEPIFRPFDKITIDESWGINIKGTIETTVGNAMFNAWCIEPVFGAKIPYLESVKLSKIESLISSKLTGGIPDEMYYKNEEKFKNDLDSIYIQEYIEFGKRLVVLEEFSPLFVYTATAKSIVAPVVNGKTVTEFKKELLVRYEGKLNDPIQLAAFEGELKKFDAEYLKDDPSFGKLLAGKALTTARKEMYLTISAKLGFENKSTVDPILNSLHEGQPTDPEQLKITIDAIRSGSLSRGADTVKGGVTAKILLRAGNGFVVLDKDCGTKLYIQREYDETMLSSLVGRYIIDGNKSKNIVNIDEAGSYIGKVLKVRTPMYCKLEGNTICRVCAGEKLFGYKEGLSIPITDISNTILYSFMKRMHTAELKTADVNVNEIFS